MAQTQVQANPHPLQGPGQDAQRQQPQQHRASLATRPPLVTGGPRHRPKIPWGAAGPAAVARNPRTKGANRPPGGTPGGRVRSTAAGPRRTPPPPGDPRGEDEAGPRLEGHLPWTDWVGGWEGNGFGHCGQQIPTVLDYVRCHQTPVIPPPPPFRFSVLGGGGHNNTLVPLGVQPKTSNSA